MSSAPPPIPETVEASQTVEASVTVVGIGADGWAGLTAAARDALTGADVLIGGARQLVMAPTDVCRGERVSWPSPLRPAVPRLLAQYAGRRIVVLASGDPMFYGIGRALSEEIGPDGTGHPGHPGRLRILPHPSSVSYACARLGWPVEDTEVVTVVGRPLARLTAALHEGRRVLVLSAGSGSPAEIAALLRERGFGPSRMRVLEQLGSEDEAAYEGTADTWPHPPGDPLNVVAVDCRRAPGALRLGATPGLPDRAYEHDGQLTKRHVRAATLCALAPAPGELLWDVGGGSGSIGIEWMRTHPSCRAVSVERSAERADRITRNAAALGVPALRVVTGAAPEALAGLPAPDAVFIGGGLTAPGLLDAVWAALPPGGRLVANTVTLESEALLARWYREHGGELVKLAVSHATAVGGFTGWRQAMPVTQWSVTKGAVHALPDGAVKAVAADSADSAVSTTHGDDRGDDTAPATADSGNDDSGNDNAQVTKEGV